ncbi:MAG: Peptidase S1, chymotrypsin [Candidatus Beckwithbacteria bacterium GW2011_GWB1_47_15]|uniref:Peptidase S1, chymotrypsin n=1 Tax=Candidatus Beckwithbacteria bacterium GW2011_GWB1_47_15 TaxID=1618371 RepID=A0A0G1UUX7_9BACT|nr:MAG: hypothetical protein UY43_C0001G0286 [Candidatus Beckwithbacteria bacterium GW2011_GWC1_49_16]KKU35207.1 MAG: Peptidase S1, chymotrypsin [Candidatus Beckwithbacteria bacterium GW2011_GWA1_46_30]KKU61515.1 MAG: Peptidase S1, chymotrypsin [Candidatus Beckwithbacteria bacterium GW2011_GWB1_47_15]KKU71719.1 MAG: Peptidase S1, chymotrypsin [Candidatus Beckwithbacteria bacterium GW2011_GWA2_47_25]KKW03817.1 MAG: Peptidase S1, chymotrypsin [Candidatus Beckwithbacteria bacterium GW2011_GWC2_49_
MFARMKFKWLKNKKKILGFGGLSVAVVGLAVALTALQTGGLDIRSLASPPKTNEFCEVIRKNDPNCERVPSKLKNCCQSTPSPSPTPTPSPTPLVSPTPGDGSLPACPAGTDADRCIDVDQPNDIVGGVCLSEIDSGETTYTACCAEGKKPVYDFDSAKYICQ